MTPKGEPPVGTVAGVVGVSTPVEGLTVYIDSRRPRRLLPPAEDWARFQWYRVPVRCRWRVGKTGAGLSPQVTILFKHALFGNPGTTRARAYIMLK